MYLVTGGAGFIGSAFLAELNSQGIDDILVVDALGSTDKWKNLGNKKFLDYLHKDQLLERIEQGRPLGPVTAVVHLGACSSTTERNAEYMMQNNYRYSRTLAQWALEKDIRFIYASSAATYGDGDQGFSDADQTSLKLVPLNVYAFSKLALDSWALRSGAANKLTGIKFFNVYGPNEYHKGDMTSVVFKAFHQIRETGKVKLFKSYRQGYGHGEQKRDFIYVKDCCRVLFWLLAHPETRGIYNLGTGHARTWNDLARAVFSAMNREALLEYIEMPEALRGKYQYFTEAEMNKLRRTGCDVPFHSLEEGVRDYVQRYLMQEYPYL